MGGVSFSLQPTDYTPKFGHGLTRIYTDRAVFVHFVKKGLKVFDRINRIDRIVLSPAAKHKVSEGI